MGTRGYYTFLYKGIYYVFYNHWDSYLDGLGQKLVNEIRTVMRSDMILKRNDFLQYKIIWIRWEAKHAKSKNTEVVRELCMEVPK